VCAYDQEADRLVNFDSNKFQPRSSGRGGWQTRAVAESSPPYDRGPRPGGGPSNGGGGGGPNGGSRQHAPSQSGAEGGRPSHLSVVARDTDEDAPPPSRVPIEHSGPRRFVIEMDETTDERA